MDCLLQIGVDFFFRCLALVVVVVVYRVSFFYKYSLSPNHFARNNKRLPGLYRKFLFVTLVIITMRTVLIFFCSRTLTIREYELHSLGLYGRANACVRLCVHKFSNIFKWRNEGFGITITISDARKMLSLLLLLVYSNFSVFIRK